MPERHGAVGLWDIKLEAITSQGASGGAQTGVSCAIPAPGIQITRSTQGKTPMADDLRTKQDSIINELKRRACEMRFGTMTVELKIHEGQIMAGEIIEKREKLG
jgi:hypothetical protein